MKGKISLWILATVVLFYIPYVNVFVKVLNTMVHEAGHALASLMTKGEVVSISLFGNTEGLTTTMSGSWFSSFFTSVFGYVFASAVAFMCAYLWSKHKHKTILVSVWVFSVVNLVFWVRNFYGIAWLLAVIALVSVLLWKVKKETIVSSFTLVLTVILVTQAFMSSFDILYLSHFTPTAAGDATNLSELTHIPTLLWGIFFFLQAAVWSFFSFRFLWKTKEKSSFLSR